MEKVKVQQENLPSLPIDGNPPALLSRAQKEEALQQVSITRKLKDDMLSMKSNEVFPDMLFVSDIFTVPGHSVIITSRSKGAVQTHWFERVEGELPHLKLCPHKSLDEIKFYLNALYSSEAVDAEFVISCLATVCDEDDTKLTAPLPLPHFTTTTPENGVTLEDDGYLQGSTFLGSTQTEIRYEDLADVKAVVSSGFEPEDLASSAIGLENTDFELAATSAVDSLKEVSDGVMTELQNTLQVSESAVKGSTDGSEISRIQTGVTDRESPQTKLENAGSGDATSLELSPGDGSKRKAEGTYSSVFYPAKVDAGMPAAVAGQAKATGDAGTPAVAAGQTKETGDGGEAEAVYKACSGLAADLLQAFSTGDQADVILKADGHVFKAHRCILAARCQYFDAMLAGSWNESSKAEIDLGGIRANSLKYILLFLYGAMIEVPASEIAPLLQASDMLVVEGLKEWLCFIITRDFCHFFHKPCQDCPKMVLDVLVLAAQFNLVDLANQCLQWVATYFRRIWELQTFGTLPAEIVDKCKRAILDQMSILNITQVILDAHDLLRSLQRSRCSEEVQRAAIEVQDEAFNFCSKHFQRLVTSPNFLSWSKGGAWCIDVLEESYMIVVSLLQPDVACEVYSFLRKLKQDSTGLFTNPTGTILASEEAQRLLLKVEERCQWYLQRYIKLVMQCPQWAALPAVQQEELLQKSSFVPVHAGSATGQSRAAQKSAKAMHENMITSVGMLCEADPALFPSLLQTRKVLLGTPKQELVKKSDPKRAASSSSNAERVRVVAENRAKTMAESRARASALSSKRPPGAAADARQAKPPTSAKTHDKSMVQKSSVTNKSSSHSTISKSMNQGVLNRSAVVPSSAAAVKSSATIVEKLQARDIGNITLPLAASGRPGGDKNGADARGKKLPPSRLSSTSSESSSAQARPSSSRLNTTLNSSVARTSRSLATKSDSRPTSGKVINAAVDAEVGSKKLPSSNLKTLDRKGAADVKIASSSSHTSRANSAAGSKLNDGKSAVEEQSQKKIESSKAAKPAVSSSSRPKSSSPAESSTSPVLPAEGRCPTSEGILQSTVSKTLKDGAESHQHSDKLKAVQQTKEGATKISPVALNMSKTATVNTSLTSPLNASTSRTSKTSAKITPKATTSSGNISSLDQRSKSLPNASKSSCTKTTKSSDSSMTSKHTRPLSAKVDSGSRPSSARSADQGSLSKPTIAGTKKPSLSPNSKRTAGVVKDVSSSATGKSGKPSATSVPTKGATARTVSATIKSELEGRSQVKNDSNLDPNKTTEEFLMEVAAALSTVASKRAGQAENRLFTVSESSSSEIVSEVVLHGEDHRGKGDNLGLDKGEETAEDEILESPSLAEYKALEKATAEEIYNMGQLRETEEDEKTLTADLAIDQSESAAGLKATCAEGTTDASVSHGIMHQPAKKGTMSIEEKDPCNTPFIDAIYDQPLSIVEDITTEKEDEDDTQISVVAALQHDDLGATLQHDELGAKLQDDDLGVTLQHDNLGATLQHDDLGATLQHEDLGATLQHDDLAAKLQHDDLDHCEHPTSLPLEEHPISERKAAYRASIPEIEYQAPTPEDESVPLFEFEYAEEYHKEYHESGKSNELIESEDLITDKKVEKDEVEEDKSAPELSRGDSGSAADDIVFSASISQSSDDDDDNQLAELAGDDAVSADDMLESVRQEFRSLALETGDQVSGDSTATRDVSGCSEELETKSCGDFAKPVEKSASRSSSPRAPEIIIEEVADLEDEDSEEDGISQLNADV